MAMVQRHQARRRHPRHSEGMNEGIERGRTGCTAHSLEHRALMAASELTCGVTSASEVASAARGSQSFFRDPRLASGLSPRAKVALGAIFMPMTALTPETGGPFVAPRLVRLGSRSLRVCGLLATRVSSHGEGMRSARIGFEFAPHVLRFRIAQHSACSTDGKRQIADTRIERKLHVKKRG
eukprot:5883163-Pleurochrysis_carterae.AAC.1